MIVIRRAPAILWCEGPKVITTRVPDHDLVIRTARAAIVHGAKVDAATQQRIRDRVVETFQREFKMDPLYLLTHDDTSYAAALGAEPFEFYPHSGRKEKLT